MSRQRVSCGRKSENYSLLQDNAWRGERMLQLARLRPRPFECGPVSDDKIADFRGFRLVSALLPPTGARPSVSLSSRRAPVRPCKEIALSGCPHTRISPDVNSPFASTPYSAR